MSHGNDVVNGKSKFIFSVVLWINGKIPTQQLRDKINVHSTHTRTDATR